jgi:hypothetical protein
MSNYQIKPKQELHELMVEVFLMIENLNINEGDYLQFADLFKQMNLSVEKLVNMKMILIFNEYLHIFTNYYCTQLITIFISSY